MNNQGGQKTLGVSQKIFLNKRFGTRLYISYKKVYFRVINGFTLLIGLNLAHKAIACSSTASEKRVSA